MTEQELIDLELQREQKAMYGDGIERFREHVQEASKGGAASSPHISHRSADL